MTTLLKRFIKPREGVRVINPTTGAPLPKEGATVDDNAEYWVRRANDGDVTMQVLDASSKTTVATVR